MINALTEKTDTRNWQTLPNKIYYTRIPLTHNENTVTIQVSTNKGASIEKQIDVNPKRNIKFVTYVTPQIKK